MIEDTIAMMKDSNMTAADEESIFSDEELFGNGKNKFQLNKCLKIYVCPISKSA